MNTVKNLAIVALLVGGTSLAMAQNPAQNPPHPGVTPGAPAQSAAPTAAPGAPAQSAAQTAAPSKTSIVHQTTRRPNKMYVSAKGKTHRSVVRAGAYGVAAAGAGYYGVGYGGWGGGWNRPLFASAVGVGGPGVGMGAALCYPTFDYSTGWNEFCPGTGFVFGTGQMVR